MQEGGGITLCHNQVGRGGRWTCRGFQPQGSRGFGTRCGGPAGSLGRGGSMLHAAATEDMSDSIRQDGTPASSTPSGRSSAQPAPTAKDGAADSKTVKPAPAVASAEVPSSAADTIASIEGHMDQVMGKLSLDQIVAQLQRIVRGKNQLEAKDAIRTKIRGMVDEILDRAFDITINDGCDKVLPEDDKEEVDGMVEDVLSQDECVLLSAAANVVRVASGTRDVELVDGMLEDVTSDDEQDLYEAAANVVRVNGGAMVAGLPNVVDGQVERAPLETTDALASVEIHSPTLPMEADQECWPPTEQAGGVVLSAKMPAAAGPEVVLQHTSLAEQARGVAPQLRVLAAETPMKMQLLRERDTLAAEQAGFMANPSKARTTPNSVPPGLVPTPRAGRRVVGEKKKDGDSELNAKIAAAAVIKDVPSTPSRSSPRRSKLDDEHVLTKAKKRAAWRNLEPNEGYIQGNTLDKMLVSAA